MQVINWNSIPLAPPDPIFGILKMCNEDKDPNKISLVVGAYRDENGKPYLFNVVKKVEEEIFKSKLDKEYLLLTGDVAFCTQSQKLAFGENSPKIATVQALSGTGALFLGATFIRKFLGDKIKIYFPDETWPNHYGVFKDAGLSNIITYPYYDPSKNALCFDKMLECIKTIEPGSVILLHACAHNPTGVDLSKENWNVLVKEIRERKIFPFIDMAYQGFATGDIEGDAYSVRLFFKENMEFMVAQSYAKNMGLYNERIGALSIVTDSKESSDRVLSQLGIEARTSYSNPPAHGARIVARILGNEALYNEWKEEVKIVSLRIQKMRKLLYDKLVEMKTPGNWKPIIEQIGMFTYTGLNVKQCERLMKNHHVYLVMNGRISVPAINEHNVDYLAKAINEVVLNPN